MLHHRRNFVDCLKISLDDIVSLNCNATKLSLENKTFRLYGVLVRCWVNRKFNSFFKLLE